jgi:hypothetical protein
VSSAPGSRFWGVVTTLGLTGAALFFLFAVMEESRNIRNPTPVFAGLAAAAIFYALLRGPVGKAIGKMLEGSAVPDEQLTERIDQLEDRLAELSNDQRGVAELEERLDFAERLLAQRGDAVQVRLPESRQ